ncbi:MAG TPA: hypothetical protein VK626_01645 [Nitrospiraceae bacterium]|nr:hypothetical protein [Nitrospiraceae bacterium]
MNRLALGLVLALIALPSFATDVTVACTPSTTDTTGAPLNPAAAVTFNLFGALQGQPKQLLAPSPLTTCSSVRKNVTPGTQCYEVSQLVAGLGESIHSPETCLAVAGPTAAPAAPGAPTVTLVTTSTIAYGLAPSNDRFAFLIVGSVPLGTACLPDQSANTFHVVPRASVTYDKPYTSKTVTTVLALCSG